MRNDFCGPLQRCILCLAFHTPSHSSDDVWINAFRTCLDAELSSLAWSHFVSHVERRPLAGLALPLSSAPKPPERSISGFV